MIATHLLSRIAPLAALVALPIVSHAAIADVHALLDSDRPLIIGHRGYASLAPENTLISFQFAMAAGADLVELDYHMSSDGVPMVSHDGTLDRCTNAEALWGGKDIELSDHTVAELKELDAAVKKPAFGPQTLPTLEEAIDTIQAASITLIERKGGEPKPCVDLLRQKSLINKVVVQSFDWDYLRGFHGLAPEQLLGALGPIGYRDGKKVSDEERVLDSEWLDEVEQTGAKLVVWNRQVTAEAIEDAHKRGMDVWVYTIDNPVEADHLLDLGVDGLITNNTGLIWKTLAERYAKQTLVAQGDRRASCGTYGARRHGLIRL